MTIDTKKRVIAIQLRRMVTIMIFAIIIILVLLIGRMPNTLLGLNKYHWGIVVFIIYLCSLLVESLLEFNYIFYNDDTDKVVIRYFSLGYLSKSKKSVEIPKAEFFSYDVIEYYSGRKKKVILRRLHNQKEVKYPSISLSILNSDELEKLLTALNSYKKV